MSNPAGRSLDPHAPADLLMEGLVEKLKLLDYELNFCTLRKPNWPALSKGYFALPPPRQKDAAEQFYYFTHLASWLLRQAGHHHDAPKQFDDPNFVLSSLISSLKSAGFDTRNLSAPKLRTGSGDALCGVLDALVDLALEAKNFLFQPRQPVVEPEYEYPDADDMDVSDDEDDAYESDDDQTAGMVGLIGAKAPGFPPIASTPPLGGDLSGAGGASDSTTADGRGKRPGSTSGVAAAGTGEGVAGVGGEGGHSAAYISALEHAREFVESSIKGEHIEKWRQDCERLGQQLRLAVSSDIRDWRSHLDVAKNNQDEVLTLLPESKANLLKLITTVTQDLDRLSNREKMLNDQFGSELAEYTTSKEHLDTCRKNHNQMADSLADLTNQLQKTEGELEDIRNQLDERGSSISDSSPVVRMKAAIRDLQKEIRDMDVRIGVVSHSLVQHALKEHREATYGRKAA